MRNHNDDNLKSLEGLPFRDPETPLSESARWLRREVLRQVEDEPSLFEMFDWEHASTCGTTRCVGGWAQYLARGRVYPYGSKAKNMPDTEYDAVALLEITEAEFYTVPGRDGLFFTDNDTALARLRKLAAA